MSTATTDPATVRWLKRALIWLVIVPALIGLVVVFSWIAMQPSMDEQWTTAALRRMAAGQEEFKAKCRVDRDGDGVGEYGFPRELSDHGLISSLLGLTDAEGIARGKQYWFRLQLPDSSGAPTVGPIPAKDAWRAPKRTDASNADAQEQRWWCYAWPEDRSRETARRAFFIDQTGVIKVFANTNWEYVGKDGAPKPDAADSPEWEPLR